MMATNVATALVFLNALAGGQRRAGKRLGPELEAEIAVLRPAARGAKRLPAGLAKFNMRANDSSTRRRSDAERGTT